ncbi:hypothetical protein ACIBL8_44030 [Streptomyces sp. NPDC050523]|uniref:hypothetical protein n=1 Tax=Streptomyces sp. NPDC050523 TaxID=3365622 RepID=UPI00378B0737
MPRTAVAAALGAAALISGPGTASAAGMHAQYWTDRCDYGRACLYREDGNVFNAGHCGSTAGLFYRFDYAKANGNSFTVYYQDGRWDFVAAWSERILDVTNIVTQVNVHC